MAQPELYEPCAKAYCGFSKGILCELRAKEDKNSFETARKNLLSERKSLNRALSKYDKLYLALSESPAAAWWLARHGYDPIQNLLRKVK